MDRNLGALVAEAGNPLSNGFLYQWGRKDPFPGGATYSNGYTTAVTTGSFTYSATSAEKGTEEYVTAHPTEFLYQNTSVQSNNDWVVGGNTDHWGSSKSIWDPCPPGYKVPAKEIWHNDLTKEAGSYAIKLDGKHWYPTSGRRWNSNGTLHDANSVGNFWTASAGEDMSQYGQGTLSTTAFVINSAYRSAGLAVRCVKE